MGYMGMLEGLITRITLLEANDRINGEGKYFYRRNPVMGKGPLKDTSAGPCLPYWFVGFPTSIRQLFGSLISPYLRLDYFFNAPSSSPPDSQKLPSAYQ